MFNINNREKYYSLNIVDKFKNFIEKFGYDYVKVRAILKSKLIMDSRRTNTAFNMSSSRSNKSFYNNAFFKKGYLLFLIYGFIMALFMFSMKENYDMKYTMVFTVGTMFMGLSFIMDFTDVFISIEDDAVLYPKPVKIKEVSLAKNLYSIIYFIKMSAIMFGPSVIAVAYNNVIEALIFLIEIIIMNIMLVSIITLIYVLIFSFTDASRIKSVITNIQVALTLVFILMFQIPSFMKNVNMTSVNNLIHGMKYYFIPAWNGSIFNIIFGKGDTLDIVSAVLLVLLPVVLYIIFLKKAEKFTKLFYKINSTRKVKEKESLWKRILYRTIAKDEIERCGMKLCNRMLDTDEKMKFQYKTIVTMMYLFPIIVFALVVFKDEGSVAVALQNKEILKFLSFLPYFSIFYSMSLAIVLNYATYYKGAVIHNICGNTKLNSFKKGVVKAIIHRALVIPCFLFAVIPMIFFNFYYFYNYIISFSVNIMLIYMSSIMITNATPFSVDIKDIKKGQSGIMLKYLSINAVAYIVIAIHVMLVIFAPQWVIMALSPLSLLALIYVYKYL